MKYRVSIYFVLSFFTVSILFWFPIAALAAPEHPKPNIVFVMIDDLGAEAVGAYGGESYKTPNMDALAKQGMQFNNAFAAPMCMISRATLMSGRYGFRSRMPSNNVRGARTNGGWGANEVTVANLLQDTGYTTAMSGKWHLAQTDRFPTHLADKGFEHQNVWAWIKGTERTRRYWEATSFRDQKWIQDPPGVYGPDQYCQYIIDFMKAQKGSDKPFFAYYPMVLIHSPWPQTPDNIDDPQPGWTAEDNLRIPETQKWSRQNFDAMIEYTDKLIGRVARSIDDLGLSENTLLIVTYRAANSSYKGMKIPGGKGKVTDAGSRVPFFAVWKCRITPGSVNDNLIDFTDVLPTLVELGGGKLPEDRRLDGQSFLGQMLGETDAPKRDWVFMGNFPKAAIRGHEYLLGADDQFYDLRENRYQPKLIVPAGFSSEQKAQFTQMKAAMDALEYPYKQGPRVRNGGKAKQERVKKK